MAEESHAREPRATYDVRPDLPYVRSPVFSLRLLSRADTPHFYVFRSVRPGMGARKEFRAVKF